MQCDVRTSRRTVPSHASHPSYPQNITSYHIALHNKDRTRCSHVSIRNIIMFLISILPPI
ncbi:hypothetical protein K458DRAFT_114191 [Lentithecium fluviatile CBS 122367]|uniref:Uncharacterized protein n=1 Tax=Lentithecium fluviatile CBS 122367 TaxID=1168545 RepID=A0A6G1INK7_9PLEO|nr:hypothetical protein K458DRAFT_114191 [Lentithecium fluviatile CBS 122367]